jgi:aspartate/tyrosine/aromatic aminotransferase
VLFEGVRDFARLSAELVLGEASSALAQGRVMAMQMANGAAACRVAFDILARCKGKDTPVYLSNPTWDTHHLIVQVSWEQ